MSDAAITVLLVEGDATDAELIQAALTGTGSGEFRVEWVRQLADAMDHLGRRASEIVLLDLVLPDARGLDMFDRIFQAAPNAVILLLSSVADEPVARQAVERGAQDYFVKGHDHLYWLPRILRYLLERKTTQDALLVSETRFRAMSDVSPLGILVSDAEGNCIYTNRAYQRISGLTLERTLGSNWSLAVHPQDRARVLADWADAVRAQASFHAQLRFLRQDGSLTWAQLDAAPMRIGERSRGHVQTVEDITERKSVDSNLHAAEEALFAEKERAQVTLNSIGDAVLTTDIDGHVTYLNLVAEVMTGWSCQEALGRPLSDVFNILDGATRLVAENPAQRAITEDKVVGLATDCILVRRDGFECPIEDSSAPIHNRDGRIAGAVIVFRDVSESRAMLLQMAHMAQHDFLTGLPNRMLLTERLSQAIGQARRHRKKTALLFLDLDFFKHINDSLGHTIGDHLLKSVAERLTTCVRATDTVCRQGGDEFVILLAEIEQPQDAAYIAEKLIAAFAAPHLVDGHELHVTLSIGVSIFPDDGEDADAVMQSADTAMYHAKANGRNNYQFYRADMNTSAVQRLFIQSSLRRALKLEEFELHYQPKVDIASGTMTGAEALIRWQDPDRGLIYPAQFVAIAEECGLIIPIGQWVLHQVSKQLRRWLDAGLCVVPVAVNISAVEFKHEHFLENLSLILKEAALDPRYIELELTESILMNNVDASAAVLEALKAMGVSLAIDDFGTGYSSLSYLKRFPINTLKIDQSFVRDIATDANDATMVSTMIGMGRNLKQRVIAEGVETHKQLAFLRTQQCDEGQGFLFSHPLSAWEFEQLLVVGNGELPHRRPS